MEELDLGLHEPEPPTSEEVVRKFFKAFRTFKHLPSSAVTTTHLFTNVFVGYITRERVEELYQQICADDCHLDLF